MSKPRLHQRLKRSLTSIFRGTSPSALPPKSAPDQDLRQSRVPLDQEMGDRNGIGSLSLGGLSLNLPLFESGGLMGGARPGASGEGLFEVAQYREGDDLHRIHWPQTLKRGALWVRRPERLSRGRLVIWLDGTASMSARIDSFIDADTRLWDEACAICVSVSHAALRGGHDVQWIIERDGRLERPPLMSHRGALESMGPRLFSGGPRGASVDPRQLKQTLSAQHIAGHPDACLLALSDFMTPTPPAALIDRLTLLTPGRGRWMGCALSTSTWRTSPPVEALLSDPEASLAQGQSGALPSPRRYIPNADRERSAFSHRLAEHYIKWSEAWTAGPRGRWIHFEVEESSARQIALSICHTLSALTRASP
jgi:hypothetical protein